MQKILEQLGQTADFVSQEDLVLVCKNAANVRVVRSNSLEEEYKSANSADWSWVSFSFFLDFCVFLLFATAQKWAVLLNRDNMPRSNVRHVSRHSSQHLSELFETPFPPIFFVCFLVFQHRQNIRLSKKNLRFFFGVFVLWP